MEENLSQETTSLADRDVILGALVPESHVVDAATGKSSDQPTEADQAGNLNDRDSASLLNADAQNHQGNSSARPRVWILGELCMVVSNGQEDKDCESSTEGSPGVGTTILVGEGGKKVLEDIKPDEAGVEREGDVDKGVIEQVGCGEDAHLDVESPDKHRVDDQQDLTHHQPVVFPGENPGGDDEVRDREVPVDSLDDNIVGKVKPLDEGKASEEEPVDGRDGVSDGGVGEVVGALAEFLGDELAVVDDGRDCTDKGEQVECLKEGWMQWHLGYMYVC